MSEHPTEYNEFVEFIECNDAAVVARELGENYIPVDDFERKIEKWRSVHPAGGRRIASKELEELIDEYS